MCYAGSMFDQGPPKPPFQPFVQALPPLQAPVWERQTWETEAEHVAFLAWLCRGKEVRDYSAAVHHSGLTREQVHSAALRCVWEIRATQWLSHTREAHREAARPLREAIAGVLARRLDAVRDIVETVALEAERLRKRAADGGPPLDEKLLARLLAVTTPVLVDLRRQAEGLPAELAAEDGPDFGALTAAELEEYKRLRDKARTG
jgi:hypothetical protein